MNGPAGATGTWRRRRPALYESAFLHCELCGRPLTGRLWVSLESGVERTFCGADCELLERSRRAAAAPSA